MTSLLNPDIIPLNLVIISSNLITTVLTLVIEHFEQVFEQLPNNDKQEGGDILHSEGMAGWMNMV